MDENMITSHSLVSLPLALMGVGSVVLAFLVYGIYQVYFHPLAKYPGPWLGKFTEAGAAYHAVKGDLHLHIWWCHQKYGPVIRYTPNLVIFNTASGMKDIYVRGKDLRKDVHYGVIQLGTKNLLTVTSPTDHARRNKIISPGFSSTAMREFEPKLLAHVHKFCKSLYRPKSQGDSDSAWGKPMVMSDWCSYFAFDVITELVFGKAVNLLGSQQHRCTVYDITGMMKRLSLLMYAPYVFLGRLDRKLFPDEMHGMKRYHRLVNTMMADAASLSGHVFSRLTNARDNKVSAGTGPAFSDADVYSEAAMLAVAGSDSTSVSLCANLFYLATYPHAYARLAQEIRTTFPTLDSIRTGPLLLQQCPYLHACIKETLRISPAVAGCPYRRVEKGDTIVVDGHVIPEGCSVGTGIYSIHHNAEYFSRPDTFLPERWLTSNADDSLEQASITTAAYTPFSQGTRACVGRHLAQMELQLALACLIWQYDFRRADGIAGEMGAGNRDCGELGRSNPHEFQLYDHIISQKRGPVLQFRPREFSQ
ncbi:cytochrome P450 [Aspergillus brunneoviolaceus CBS 621.78]|uniref:Cytochrome P450 n=1 Tax=Aspergillus brunneoviolaceus CBS 621.78 TaxID=1450534 RepID=A0ACD1FZ67_9EURO|nr:cytochrome P450 [Aspergillus brunneoviolaceus CBS 621.78]RAH42269.1 cytochrome P450 [Aspergillus brunneoviolaceus CBS 621.78]